MTRASILQLFKRRTQLYLAIWDLGDNPCIATIFLWDIPSSMDLASVLATARHLSCACQGSYTWKASKEPPAHKACRKTTVLKTQDPVPWSGCMSYTTVNHASCAKDSRHVLRHSQPHVLCHTRSACPTAESTTDPAPWSIYKSCNHDSAKDPAP